MLNPAQFRQPAKIHTVTVHKILGVQFTSLGFKRDGAFLKLLIPSPMKGYSAISPLKHTLNHIGNLRDAACTIQRPVPCKFTLTQRHCTVGPLSLNMPCLNQL